MEERIHWFSNNIATVGILLYTDKSGNLRAGISAVKGNDEAEDIQYIKDYGAKFPLLAAKKLFNIPD